jgi:hypothetical protein
MHDFAKLKLHAGSLKGSLEADRSVKSLATTVERLCESCLALQARVEELEKKLQAPDAQPDHPTDAR